MITRYSVKADVLDDSGAIVDTVTVAIGIRDAIWTANTGFMLNGFKVPAKGFSQHQVSPSHAWLCSRRVAARSVLLMHGHAQDVWLRARADPVGRTFMSCIGHTLMRAQETILCDELNIIWVLLSLGS